MLGMEQGQSCPARKSMLLEAEASAPDMGRLLGFARPRHTPRPFRLPVRSELPREPQQDMTKSSAGIRDRKCSKFNEVGDLKRIRSQITYCFCYLFFEQIGKGGPAGIANLLL